MKIKTNYIILGGDSATDNYTFIHSDPYNTTDIYPSGYSIIQPLIPLHTVKTTVMLKQTIYDFLNNYKMPLRIVNK